MRPPAANRRPRTVTCAAFVVSVLTLAAPGGASARVLEGPESSTLAVADLSVVKTGSPSAVAVGDEITYTLTVTNHGPDAAEEVILTDFLPPETAFVSASSGCTHSEGVVECPLGSMASGASVTKTITVTAQAAPTRGVVWFNNAEVTAATDDPDADNNLAEAATTVKWQLSVTKEGSGTGTVTSAPPGINCGADCTETFDAGTVVTLTATAGAGSRFAGWGGACAGTSTTCEVTMNAARAVTARFTAVHALSVTKEGSGTGTVTSSPAGIDCGTDCAESFDAGTVVTLTANASVGSSFAGWGGACSGASTTCEVTMDAAKSVSATFSRASYALSVTKEGSGTGTVTSSPAGIDCGADCTETFDAGTVVTLTATAGAGSRFAGWGGACAGTSTTCEVTMNAARAVTARFTAVHALSVTKEGSGTGTVTSSPAGIDCGTDCAESFDAGTVVTLTANASVGSSFAGWGGACSGASTTCEVTMDAAKSVSATFSRASYALSVTKEGSGTGTVTSSPAGIDCGADCTETFDAGTVVTLTATAGAGSRFAGWGGACAGANATCTVAMDSAKSVTANFEKVVYVLSVAKSGTGSGTVTSSPGGIDCGATCLASFDPGTVVTLTAIPSAGATFGGWGGACSGMGATCTVTMDAAKSVTATFNGPVTPPNNPPSCSGVKATPKRLWPPDHRMRLVTLAGATDPNGDPVALRITGVTQDEPLRRQGRGDRAPDARWVAGRPNQVKLRAERKGTGNGRVYRIAFTVSDGRGGTCTGIARVEVRHSRHRAAVDSGRSFNSFGA